VVGVRGVFSSSSSSRHVLPIVMEYKCSQLRLPRVGEVPAAVMVGERIPAKASQRPASFGTQQCAPHARPSVCTAGSLKTHDNRS
jgi:hypothetical protein